MTPVLARYATQVAIVLGAAAVVVFYPLRLLTGNPEWGLTALMAVAVAAVVLLLARTHRVEAAARLMLELDASGRHRGEEGSTGRE